jgi:hypothetical protein
MRKMRNKGGEHSLLGFIEALLGAIKRLSSAYSYPPLIAFLKEGLLAK